MRSHGLWEASAPKGPACDRLRGQIDADIAIVGAGFTGLSAALHAAEGGAKVAIVEAVDIGFGASGRNVGLVNAGMWIMPSKVRATLGNTYGNRLIKVLAEAPSVVFELVQRHGIDCEAVRNGTLHCAAGRKGADEIAERARQWTALGAPVELCNRRKAQELTGTGVYEGALLDRRAGTIQPLAYARGLAGAAMRVGVDLFTDTRIERAQYVDGAWHLSAPDQACIRAQWVIVATDAYTVADGLWGGIRREQILLPYFNLATSPLPRDIAAGMLPQRQGAWDTRLVLSSFRLDAAGRVIFGSVGALRGVGRKIHHDWGRRALSRLYPQLGNVDFEHEWYGAIGMTANALPRFHQLAPNVISVSGYSGRGIAPGTVLGRELAKFAIGDIGLGDLSLPVVPVEGAHLRQIREVGYEAGAQLVHFADARKIGEG